MLKTIFFASPKDRDMLCMRLAQLRHMYRLNPAYVREVVPTSDRRHSYLQDREESIIIRRVSTGIPQTRQLNVSDMHQSSICIDQETSALTKIYTKDLAITYDTQHNQCHKRLGSCLRHQRWCRKCFHNTSGLGRWNKSLMQQIQRCRPIFIISIAIASAGVHRRWRRHLAMT